MGRLIYVMATSLDGFVADEGGGFEWAAPDEEVHAFANDLERSVTTHLYGRRMYEVMQYWATAPTGPGADPVEAEYAELWRQADHVVYCTTLDAAPTPLTRVERSFEPDAVRALVAAVEGDVAVSGPGLAATALRAGLVDEVGLLVVPVVVGGGHRALPPSLRLDLELLEERRFTGGTVFLRYRVRRPTTSPE